MLHIRTVTEGDPIGEDVVEKKCQIQAVAVKKFCRQEYFINHRKLRDLIAY